MTQRLTLSRIFIGILVLVFFATVSYAVFNSAQKVGAAPGLVTQTGTAGCYSNSTTTPPTTYGMATSTVIYMTPGTATTTVTCNLGQEGSQSASLLVQVNASSTLSQFRFYMEESLDGVDYYPISATSFVNVASSTNNSTYSLPIGGSGSSSPAYTYTFASSTPNGVAIGLMGLINTNNRSHFVADVPVRLRYVRVYAAMTGTIGFNGAIWMQLVPKGVN